MYKYVQRRLRDIVEKTYSILDVQKTWTCNKTLNVENGGHSNGGCNGSKPIVVVRPAFSELCNNSPNVNNQRNAGELWLIPERKDPGTNGTKEKCHKKSREHHYEAWISALTWSSALVCGWYASQLLCLHRRNLGWDTRCCYSKIFMSPSRAFHANILTKLAFATPFPRHTPQFDTPQRRYFHHLKRVEAAQNPSTNRQQQETSGIFEATNVNNTKESNKNVSQYLFEDNEELHDLHKYVINISNDDEELKEVLKSKTKSDTENIPPKDESNSVTKTVEEAVNDLLSVLGEIEFQLGVKSINLGDFETAVSHLKLATSHHHAGATFNLGICFEQGLGIKQDMHHAMECYQAAADLGHPQAIYNLGIFYAQGLGGLKKSRKAAKKCFETAARLGVIEAKLALGLPITPTIAPGMSFDFNRTQSAIKLQQVQMNSVLVS